MADSMTRTGLPGSARPVRLALYLALAVMASAMPSAAATFNYLPTPIDVTPTLTGWRDVDVSANVPAGATGVIIQWDNLVTGNDEDFGIRKKGSTDGFFVESGKDGQQGWLMTGLDANRVFQVYLGALGPKTYLIGYTMAGVTFLTNRVDKSTATTGTYQDVTIAADTGSATAIGAIFVMYPNAGSGADYALRKKGSTDDRYTLSRARVANVVLVGVDGVETAQQKIANVSMDLYLVGYVTSGAVYFTNAVNRSTGTTGSYVSEDMTADLGAGVANGVFLEISDTAGNDRNTGLRPGGSTYDLYAPTRHQWAVAGLDAGDVFQQQIENATHDLYMVGYSLADGAGTFRVKSGSYVGTGGALSITGLGFSPDVVIVDGDGGGPDAAIKTRSMAGADSKQLDDAQPLDTVHITSLDADGFSVGTDPDVNQFGVTYHWVAFKAAPGVMKVGSYAGSAGAQNISGVGFTPAYVFVMSPNAAVSVQRSDLMLPNLSVSFDANGYNNAILNMQSNGFGLGTNGGVAQAATTFHYVAFNRAPGRISLGSYTGNGANDRDITGTGFLPEYVLLSRSSDTTGSQGNPPTHKPASTGVNTDGSLICNGNVFEADNIQKLQPDGFQVGQHQRVNSSLAPNSYYWIAFGPHFPRAYYRSAGTTAANLNTSAHTVTISGNTATFSGAMPANVGVGDVLQYQVTGTFYLAFVSGRTSSTVYAVQSASGGPPQAAVAGTAVSVFRAYTSLSNWQAQDENDSFDNTVEDFDTSRDLVTADATMQVACYNDAPMNDMVNVATWTTGPTNYIRIFTPVGGYQVGVSQRHNGTAGSGFRLTPVAAGASYQIVNLNTGYVRVEGLEIDGAGVTNAQFVRGIRVETGISNVGDIRIDSCVIHDLHTTQNGFAAEGSMGIHDFQQTPTSGPPMIVTNNVIYDITNVVNVGHIAGIHIGSRATSYVYNNTVFRIINTGSACAPDCGPAWGIYSKAFGGGTVDVIASNNFVGSVSAVNPVQVCYGTQSGAGLTQSFNVASDTTAAGTGSVNNQTNYAAYFQNIMNGSENLHLTATSAALWGAPGTDLSATFVHDVDGQLRNAPWDVGADESNGTTAVKLMSFDAAAGDSEVRLAWRTASELDNLGFHLYRGASADGPWTRLTKALIPGLGSSPVGQAYAFKDGGLTNGTRYFYRLEDVDASSLVTSHGPVSAVPLAGAASEDPGDRSRDRRRKIAAGETCPVWVLAAHPAGSESTSGTPPRCTRHGDPEAVSLVVLSRDARQATLELRTGGFYALHEPSGRVRAFVPGFDFPDDPKAPALPLRRALVEAVVGRRVTLAGVRALELAAFPGLVPSALGSAEMQVAWDGTVRAARRNGGATKHLAASHMVRLLPPVFQGETKSAALELSPLRFDAQRRQIVLARRLRVRLLFTGREPGESGNGSRGRRRNKPHEVESEVIAQLFATGRGLHAAPFEQLFPGARRGVAASELRLQRLGEAVAFHVEPDALSFGPGGRLYFFADAAAGSTAYSPELAFELVRSGDGLHMRRTAAAPSGAASASAPLGFAAFETNRFYQPGLLDAVDPWLWEAVASGATRTLAFNLAGLDAASPVGARLEIRLQGASESGRPVDHHLRVSLNDVPVGEAHFAGKRPYLVSLELPASVAREGANQLAITNVADTGVTSLVFVDRFNLAYSQAEATRGGRFEGSWSEGGAVTVATDAAVAAVVDVTEAGTNGGSAAWLTRHAAGAAGTGFTAQAGRRYLVATAAGVSTPRVAIPQPSTLRAASNQADYLLIGPRAFLEAAEPLVARRGDQGLSARAVAVEEIYDAFGHGEPSADAIRAFLAYAFHSWARPSPRYVVLLGDSSYDPRNFIGSSPPAPLPASFVKTSYLWTASDPLLGAVNGDDALPDIALGRVPAASVEEATRLVSKLLAWEESAQGLGGPATLVADNPDQGGDFEANTADIAQSFLPGRSERLLLRELGAATRPRVQDALDSGLSFLSYVGHGGAAVWASENVWNTWDAASLQAQSRQPLLLTMNCLNGYFVAPSFDSLAESLVKPDGRGAIAAISPSGLSLDAPAHEYHRALMAELTSGRHERLGDALLAAQTFYGRAGLMPELLSIYHLFGDPAMVLRQN